MSKNTFYITTPIYYASGKPHLGHVYTTIASDVLARWNRDLKKEVFFQTGTDEHGQKIKEEAQKENKSPKEFVDNIVKDFEALSEKYNISNDYFLRTTNEEHKKFVQEMLQRSYDNGDIYKSEYEGLYCVGCERYYTEEDLIDGKICPDHKVEVSKLKEENYFFRLSKYEDSLIKFYEENEDFISPKTKKQEILNRVKEGLNRVKEGLNRVKEGLNDISISRRKEKLDWGIELPFDSEHVTYVWFDALFNYLSSLNFLDKKGFWPADVHIVGHDIMWFHTVYWPAFLMSVEEELPKKVFSHGMILDKDGHKMSKSLGNVIHPEEEKEEFGLDELRFYLLSSATFGEDMNYSREKFIEKINNELNNDLGNLVSRVHAMTGKYFESKIPKIGELSENDKAFISKLNIFEDFNKNMQELKFNMAIEKLFEAIRETNAYVNQESPWKIEDKNRLATVMNILNSAIILFAKYINCIMPSKASRVFKQYNIENDLVFEFSHIEEGHKLGEKDNIFEKKKREKIEEKVPSKFSKLNLKVGKIIEIEDHSEADKLFVEKIDVGEDKPRQIVSGLKDYYTKEEMLNKKVIVVANLKAAELRGTLSEGMVLAAEDKEKNVGLVTSNAPIGSHLIFDNEISNSEDEITIEEFSKIKMKSDGEKITYQNIELKIQEGKLSIDKKVSGKIR